MHSHLFAVFQRTFSCQYKRGFNHILGEISIPKICHIKTLQNPLTIGTAMPTIPNMKIRITAGFQFSVQLATSTTQEGGEYMANKPFHQVIKMNLTVNPGKFLRYFNAEKRPTDDQLKEAVSLASDLIEDFELTMLKLDELPNYLVQLRYNNTAMILLCLNFADFYMEITSANNRGKLPPATVSTYQSAADNILTYLRLKWHPQIDENKIFQWAMDKQSPPSARSSRHPSVPNLKSPSVQPARPNSSMPPAS